MTFYFQEFREFSVFQDMFDSACRTFFYFAALFFQLSFKKLFMFFRSLVTIENYAVEKLHFGLILLNKKSLRSINIFHGPTEQKKNTTRKVDYKNWGRGLGRVKNEIRKIKKKS